MNGRDYGVRMGIGGVATKEMRDKQRQQNINKSVNEVYGLKHDPYLIETDMGSFECKLCSTTHRSKENYYLHTEGKKHKENLAVKQYYLTKLKKKTGGASNQQQQQQQYRGGTLPFNNTNLGPTIHTSGAVIGGGNNIIKPRVGKPNYTIIKQYHQIDGFHCISFKLDYSLIDKGIRPRYRIINTYQQNIEQVNELYQYIVFAAEPYENVAFKIPNIQIDMTKVLRDWDNDNGIFLLQLKFRDEYGSTYRKQQQQLAQQQQQQQQQLAQDENQQQGKTSSSSSSLLDDIDTDGVVAVGNVPTK